MEDEMDLDRLSTGEKVAGGSAVLLFIFMFFDWFKVEVSGAGFVGGSLGGNAWEWFTWIDLLMLLTVIVALAVVVIRLSDAVFEPPVSLNAVVAVLGGLSVLFVLYRIIDPPGASESFGGVSVDVGRQIGVFLGLIAAAGITYGGYRAMQEEGTTFGEIGDNLSNRGGPGAGTTPPPSATPPPPPPPPSSGQGGPPPQ
jgi:uncharacterized membrane protein YhaH (DUF805 family)